MDIDSIQPFRGQMGIPVDPGSDRLRQRSRPTVSSARCRRIQVNDFIARIRKDKLGGEAQDLLKSAEEALATGNADEAVELFAAVLQDEPGNVPALAGLARAHVLNGALDQAKETLALIPEAKRNDAAAAAARSALEVAEQAQSVGPVGELEQKVAANPLDHQARFELAVALNAAGKREEAADHLLAIVKRDRQMERRRRAQAAGAVLRRVGTDRRGDAERAAEAVVIDLVCVELHDPEGYRFSDKIMHRESWRQRSGAVSSDKGRRGGQGCR